VLGLCAASCGGRSGGSESPPLEAGSIGADGGGADVGDGAVGPHEAGADSVASAADGGGVDATVTPDPGGTSPPSIGPDGYLTIDAGAYQFVGYVASSVGGSSSTISLTFGPTSFCASGVVGENDTFNSWATAGFNVDQVKASQATAKTLLLSASSITVAFSNQGGSPLMIQLIDQGFNYWCYPLTGATSPVTIPLTSFNSACWDNSGQAFTPGTAIQAIQLEVPGSNAANTPYSFCFFGMTIQPLADAGVVDAAGVDDGAASLDF
jgi:hypothetical protein